MRKWLVPVCAMVISVLLLSGCGGAVAPPAHVEPTPPTPSPPPVEAPLPVEAPPVIEAEPTPEPKPVVAPPAPPAPSSIDDAYRNGAPAIEPVDPLLPPPGEVPGVWQPLDQAVREVAGQFKGRISVVAVELTTGARYEFRPGDRYYPASTFKLPVTLCTVQAIDRGELTWETPVTFTKEDDDTVGQGRFIEAEYGSKWPVRNLLDRSLVSSNNVAVKMLARTLTLDGLAKCTAAMGGTVTRDEFGSTPVSAPDEAAWWLALWQMHQEKPALAENLLRPLRRVDYEGRIMAGTPRHDLVTHKYGTFPPYEHDGAIIWGERPYILVVLTYGGTHESADQAIVRLAGTAWEAVYR